MNGSIEIVPAGGSFWIWTYSEDGYTLTSNRTFHDLAGARSAALRAYPDARVDVSARRRAPRRSRGGAGALALALLALVRAWRRSRA